jgi:hypothetical protein
MNSVIRLWVHLVAAYRSRIATSDLRSESGQVVNEWLGLSVLAIIAIVAIGAALKLLGLDIVDWIRAQLGV